MSASSHTDWTVRCDAADCMAQERTDTLELPFYDSTATAVRRVLKRRGWDVAVRTHEGIPQKRRLDFCPDHAAANQEARQ